METSSFVWVSPQRVRGSKAFKNCTRCGARLFIGDNEVLEFEGTHPRSVLCLDCWEAQQARSSGASLGYSFQDLKSTLRSVDSVRPTSLAVSLLALIVVAGFLTMSVAVRTAETASQSTPFQGIQDLALIYVPPGQDHIASNYLAPYVSYLDHSGESREWLFDSFLFLAISRDTYSTFWGPTTASDWIWWIDKVFQKDQQLEALDQEIERAKKALGSPSKRGVIISMPYPSPEVANFGRRSEDGSFLDFRDYEGRTGSGLSDRTEACMWFVDQVLAEWAGHSYRNLEFLGFYWFQEELLDDDPDLVQAVSEHIHKRGHKFYWIPFNSEANFEAVEANGRGELGFDYIWIQPNYAFKDRAGERWRELRDVDLVARAAGELNASIEIEVDEHVFLHGDLAALNNFYHYLDAGLTHLYVDKPLAYYVFPYQMFWSKNSLVRQSYEALCHFVKGRHSPVSYLLHRDIGNMGPDYDHPSIHLKSRYDWGPREELDGIYGCMAAPGAEIAIGNLDAHKDVFLAIRYLTFRPTSVSIHFENEIQELGELISDGLWHTVHWRIELSRLASKSFEVSLGNLTWVSAVWVYPDETIFRLDPAPAIEGPGLFPQVAPNDGIWTFDGGKGVVFSESDPQSIWLVGITYRSRTDLELELVNGRPFQTVNLPRSSDWRTVTFHTNPHDGSNSILYRFKEKVEVLDMWTCPPKVHTNVGTAWDTNTQRHTPGISIGSEWSAARFDSGEVARTYRSGGRESTVFVAPFGDNTKGVLLTLEYRSQFGPVVTEAGGESGVVADLPPAPGWTKYSFAMETDGTDLFILEFSASLDLASAWVEPLE